MRARARYSRAAGHRFAHRAHVAHTQLSPALHSNATKPNRLKAAALAQSLRRRRVGGGALPPSLARRVCVYVTVHVDMLKDTTRRESKSTAARINIVSMT